MREFQDDPRSDEEVCACFPFCLLILTCILSLLAPVYFTITIAPTLWDFLFLQVLGSIKEIYFSDTSFDSSDHELHVSELAVEAASNQYND